MSVFNENAIIGAAYAAAAGGDFDIPYSCRFSSTSSSDSAIFTRVPSTTGSQQKYTISFWWKFGDLYNAGGSKNYLIGSWHTAGSGGGRYWLLQFNGDQLHMSTGDASDLTDPSPTVMELKTNRKFRDISAWYHICVSVDTTQVTASDRGKLYINGVQETSLAIATYGSQNDIHFINHTNTTMQVGGLLATGWTPTQNYVADGYIAEYHQIDGTALDHTSFGESGDYGEWKPIKFSGAHGTNGFYLDFKTGITYETGDRHNTSPPGIVVTDAGLTHAGGSLNSGLIDGTITTSGSTALNWTTHTPSAGAYLQFAFPTARTFTNAKWYQDTLDTHGTWQWMGSNVAGGASGYVNIGGTFTLGGGSIMPAWTESLFPSLNGNTTAYLYYRMAWQSGAVSYNSWIGEIEFGTGSGSIGSDASGNNNNLFAKGLNGTEIMLDSPSNNFCIINHLDGSVISGDVYSEGNLSYKNTANAGSPMKRASFGMRGGKWYWEVLRADTPGEQGATLGILPSAQGRPTGATIGSTQIPGGIGIYGHTALLSNGGTIHGTSQSQQALDVIQWAWDGDTGKLWLGYNGTWRNSGNPATAANPWASVTAYATNTYSPAFQTHNNVEFRANFGQDSTFAGAIAGGSNTDDNEYGNFKYDVPAGFLALCTKNLPEPTVVPSEHFNIVTYTGDGASSHPITGVGFQPDFLWQKGNN